MKETDREALARLHDRPLFIVFEGIDGSGKSTQARLLSENLGQAGVPVLLTREPSDGPTGLRIRSLTARPSPEEEARLFTEDRCHHLKHVVEPAIARGSSVICDRYILSSAAYQGARGIDPRALIAENLQFARIADVTFLLVIPVPVALERIAASRAEGFSLFEARRDLEAVDRMYRSLADETITMIDASLPVDEVQDLLIRHLAALSRSHRSRQASQDIT